MALTPAKIRYRPAAVSNRFKTASRASRQIKPTATRATPRSTRSAGRAGSVATQPAARRSGALSSTGRISEAAAAATTAPEPARIQAAVRRSPRNASHSDPTAARASGPST